MKSIATKQDQPSKPLSVEHALGSLGLLLIVLVGWACDQPAHAPRFTRQWGRSLLASMVIASVTAIGWLVDRVPPTAAKDEPGHSTEPRTYVEPHKY